MIDDIESERFEAAEEFEDGLEELEEIEHIREQLTINKRRLRELRKRQSLKGLETDPSTIIEIEDLESQIEELEEKLK
jgi:hypothetical protein